MISAKAHTYLGVSVLAVPLMGGLGPKVSLMGGGGGGGGGAHWPSG